MVAKKHLRGIRKIVNLPCSQRVFSASQYDGDCQATKLIGRECSFEWLGTCRYRTSSFCK